MPRDDMRRLADDEAMRQRRQAVVDPLRMRIVGLLGESDGMTVRELGARLGITANRLYYHIRILEQAGIIGVVDSRVEGRVVERVYKDVYQGRYVWDAANPVEMAMHLGASMEIARHAAEEMLYERARRLEAGEPDPIVTWGMPGFDTTHEEIAEFANRMNALQHEFRQRANELEAAGRPKPDELRRARCFWLVYEQDLDDAAAPITA